MRQLIVYPNNSMGGVSAVLRARAAAHPEVYFDLVFGAERGGSGAYRDLPNVSVRVLPKGRRESFFKYLSALPSYEEVRVLSDPESANTLAQDDRNAVIYEFHSSHLDIVERELAVLDSDRIASFVVPSEHMREAIIPLLAPRLRNRLIVEPNLVDLRLFCPEGPAPLFTYQPGTPLVWVGRFDSGKGAFSFARLLALLPQSFFGVVITSLESDPSRMSRFLAECRSLGVEKRVRHFSNLPQPRIADVYRSARVRGGWHVSTSLAESFGYSTYEARACGLRTIAFDLPAWEPLIDDNLVRVVSIGDLHRMAELILEDAD